MPDKHSWGFYTCDSYSFFPFSSSAKQEAVGRVQVERKVDKHEREKRAKKEDVKG